MYWKVIKRPGSKYGPWTSHLTFESQVCLSRKWDDNNHDFVMMAKKKKAGTWFQTIKTL